MNYLERTIRTSILKCKHDIPMWMGRYLSISEQIKHIRQALGLTQSQLARRARTTQHMVATLENPSSSPSLRSLQRTATALNCDLHVLMIPKKPITALISDQAHNKATDILNYSRFNHLEEDSDIAAISDDDDLIAIKEELLYQKKSRIWD